MPGGKLPRDDTELVILRVAHNTGCEYEWGHHERIGTRAGLERRGDRPGARGRRGAGLVAAAGAAPARRRRAARRGRIGDALWGELRAMLDEVELIELCMLVGHYEMLAMTLNTLASSPSIPAGARRCRTCAAGAA